MKIFNATVREGNVRQIMTIIDGELDDNPSMFKNKEMLTKHPLTHFSLKYL